jgi:hypothetical protein
MSLRDPNDKSIHQFISLGVTDLSYGRITVEDWDKVITIQNGCTLEIELNKPTQYDPKPTISIVIRGGRWSIDEKKSKTVKNAFTIRGQQLNLSVDNHNLKYKENDENDKTLE